MQILILGGTVFLGRHLIECALDRGHTVTLFNRGQSGPHLYLDVEHLRGDRVSDLTALRGRHWDAVIDTSGFVPRYVQATAQLLAGAVEHYTFISTVSVYPLERPGQDERALVATLPTEEVSDLSAYRYRDDKYGPLKALCEEAVEQALPGRVLTIRPGLIVGPHDPTDRFTYWPHRVARGGTVLAPGHPAQPVRFIDVRDLAGWIISMVEAGLTGTYNADGSDNLTFGQLLDACRAVSGSDARFVWADDTFLLEAGIVPWTEFPLWLPQGIEATSFWSIDCSKARAAGLKTRPVSETILATLAWDTARPAERTLQPLLSPEREQQLLLALGQQR